MQLKLDGNAFSDAAVDELRAAANPVALPLGPLDDQEDEHEAQIEAALIGETRAAAVLASLSAVAIDALAAAVGDIKCLKRSCLIFASHSEMLQYF